MPRRTIKNPQLIYDDYKIALLTGKPVHAVIKHHGITSKYLTLLRRRYEAQYNWSMGDDLRKDIYNNRYKHMQDLLDKRKRPEVQKALWKSMYFVSGFSRQEIAELTKKPLKVVIKALVDK